MSEIEHVSSQVLTYAQEAESAISDLMQERGLTFEQAAKCVELGLQNMHNDVLWKRMEGINYLHLRVDSEYGDGEIHVRLEK